MPRRPGGGLGDARLRRLPVGWFVPGIMVDHSPAASGPRRFRASLWWLLATLLGAVTLWSLVQTVHDTSQQREAAVQVVRTTAGLVATVVASRLELLAAGTFAPAAPWSSAPAMSPADAVRALIAAQVEGLRCQCRSLVPATHFLAFRSGASHVEVGHVSPAEGVGLSQDLLRRLSTGVLGLRPGSAESSLRVVVDPELPGQVVLLVGQAAPAGPDLAAYGAVVRAEVLARAIIPTDTPPGTPAPSSLRGIFLDTLSLVVQTADSVVVFGRADPNRPYIASGQAGGALTGMTLTLALTGPQVPFRIMVNTDRLWLLGLLMACTILLVVLAAGSSRRETLLARARSDFIAGISHDLRMPLAQILLAGETLALGRADGEAERGSLADTIVREARRLTGLVDNVLQFSRSGAVAPTPARQVVSVASLFREVIEAVELSVSDAGQRLRCQDGTPLEVLGDQPLLRQALVNLVDNAIKYGSPGQTIRLAAESSGGDWVRLLVEDQGPGVPVAVRSRLFEAYARLPEHQVSERTGTGLGLTVVRQIAEACGGSASLEEAPGGGARAVITLPAARGHRSGTKAAVT
ncbi:MAG: HAMP domain-containing sensor histidine kinase [Gemmatimonadota bacterium]|nr:HAMP domain-containing sensor histidine kinase [Gemmatimonadota bacterium]